MSVSSAACDKREHPFVTSEQSRGRKVLEAGLAVFSFTDTIQLELKINLHPRGVPYSPKSDGGFPLPSTPSLCRRLPGPAAFFCSIFILPKFRKFITQYKHLLCSRSLLLKIYFFVCETWSHCCCQKTGLLSGVVSMLRNIKLCLRMLEQWFLAGVLYCL